METKFKFSAMIVFLTIIAIILSILLMSINGVIFFYTSPFFAKFLIASVWFLTLLFSSVSVGDALPYEMGEREVPRTNPNSRYYVRSEKEKQLDAIFGFVFVSCFGLVSVLFLVCCFFTQKSTSAFFIELSSVKISFLPGSYFFMCFLMYGTSFPFLIPAFLPIWKKPKT